MIMKKLMTSTLTALTIAAFSTAVFSTVTFSTVAVAADDSPVRWKMQSWFPSKAPHAGTTGKDIETKLNTISGGNFRVRFYEPGALIPPKECFEAVGKGSVEACWSTPAYWYGNEPALALFSAAPFGMEWPGLMAWFYYGGGQEIYEKLYAKHNMYALPCGGMIPEASGWFKKEIKTIDDFKGLRMRFLGLGALVLEDLGASTMLLGAAELYPSLERGVIDATEFAAPSVDKALGLHEIVKYYYFPGWHQPATIYDLMINLDAWKALSVKQKAMVKSVCGDNVRQAIALGESMQPASLDFFKEKGVQIRRWSPEILGQLKSSWEKVAAKESDKNPEFAETWKSMQAFRKRYDEWLKLGYLDR